MNLKLKMHNLYEINIRRFSWKYIKEKINDTDFMRHRRQKRIPQFPITLQIETTSACNLSCVMCPSHEPGNPMARGARNMEFEVYKKIIDESVKYGKRRKIFLYKDGEPLIHNRLGEFIRYAKDKDAADMITVTTNGILLDEKRARMLIESGLDELMISIDAATPETYYKIKRAHNFETVVRNAENFFRLRESMGKKMPFAKVKFLVQDLNRHEADQFRSYWEPIADEVFIVEDLNTWDGNSEWVNENVGASASYKKAIEIARKGDDNRYPCDRLWYQFVINSNGNSSPCICDWNEKGVLGNVKEKSVYAMWHSQQLREMRRCHVDGEQEKIDMCRNCERWINVNMGDWFIRNREKALAIHPEREIR